MYPELSTFCDQARLQVEEMENQLSLINFDLCLTYEICWGKDGLEIEGVAK